MVTRCLVIEGATVNLKTLKIGVVGGGVVGHATGKAWEGHVAEVLTYDVRPERANALLSEVLRCDLIFVCLPTPQREGSLECNTDALVCFFERLTEQQRQTNLVIKSTVPIGFTRRTAELIGCPNLGHSPEFLTARTAVEDAANPTRNVIGYVQGADGKCKDVLPDGRVTGCPAILSTLYKSRWPSVPLFHLSSDESESVKLAQNAFSAVKVSFFNELHELCVKSKMDFETVRRALLAGGWINPNHTQVPGPDGRCGWGGVCLGKDTSNWVNCCENIGMDPCVATAALNRNKIDRRPA